MRNDPCPCGSGKKYKKCHGAPVPPEVAVLPSEARAEWQRAEVLLQRQKRLGQEILDWATKKLGIEWTDAALDAWGLGRDEDVSEAESDMYTGWVLVSYVPPTLDRCIAAAWLDEAGKRASADDQAFMRAALAARFGVWEAETVEEGVGTTLTDRLTGRTVFVHEREFTYLLAPSELVCAYVLECDGVHVFAGLHDLTLLQPDGVPFVNEFLAEAGLTTPVPDATVRDAAFVAKLMRRWHALAATVYERELQEIEDSGELDDLADELANDVLDELAHHPHRKHP